jgi:hypothetical protein
LSIEKEGLCLYGTIGRKVFEIHLKNLVKLWTTISTSKYPSSSTLETEIVIDRPPENIKAVFMDWPRYSLLKGDIDHPASSFTQLKVSIKVDDNKPCMNFTPQLLINNTNEFRWVGTVFGKWFLADEHWFQFLPLENRTKARFVQGECFTGLRVGLFKLMVSVENTFLF